MKIAIITRLFAKWNMYINACQCFMILKIHLKNWVCEIHRTHRFHRTHRHKHFFRSRSEKRNTCVYVSYETYVYDVF
ncbi:MAG: hypothetical protein RL329_688 [Bacteroidota bacterium]